MIAVIALEGRLSHDTSRQMYQALESALRARCRTIILCLGRAELVVSTGIRLFVDINDRMQDANGRLILCDLPSEVEFGLNAALVTDFFEVKPTLDEALETAGVKSEDLRPGLPDPRKTDAAKKRKATQIAAEKKRHQNQTELQRNELREVIRQCFPGRLAIEIVRWYLSENHSIATPEAIAKALGEGVTAVRRMMGELETRGVLRSQYLYSPEPELRKKIKMFFDRLKELESEQKKPAPAAATASPPPPKTAVPEPQKSADQKPHAPPAVPHAEATDETDAEPSRPEPVKNEPEVSEKDLQKVVTRYLNSRLAVSIIDWFVSRNKSLGDAAGVSEALGEKKKAVTRAMHELNQRGVLKKLGGDQFNYAPEATADAQIREFLRRWYRHEEHGKLLSWVLSSED